MICPVMSRAEADKIIAWAETALTITLAPWQKEIFAIMLLYPDLELHPVTGFRRSPVP